MFPREDEAKLQFATPVYQDQKGFSGDTGVNAAVSHGDPDGRERSEEPAGWL